MEGLPRGPASLARHADRVKRLYVVRHGETDWNRERRIQGSTDVHLNQLGRDQAAAAAGALAKELSSPVVVTSPLARARDTARILADACAVSMHVDARLAERAYGVWEGLTPHERRTHHPEASATWESGLEPVVLEGYEYHHAVAGRMRAAFEEWAQTVPGDLVFVTHGSSGRMLLLDLIGLPHNSSALGYLGNCTWSVVHPYGEDAFTVFEHNQRATPLVSRV